VRFWQAVEQKRWVRLRVMSWNTLSHLTALRRCSRAATSLPISIAAAVASSASQPVTAETPGAAKCSAVAASHEPGSGQGLEEGRGSPIRSRGKGASGRDGQLENDITRRRRALPRRGLPAMLAELSP
jgi:hypothetical protein